MTRADRLPFLLALVSLAACNGGGQPTDAGADVDGMAPLDGGALPDVAGATTVCQLGWPVPNASVPDGYCVRRFTQNDQVLQPRTLSIAPNGDVFLGSPLNGTPGGGGPGLGAIVVLADDNHDGVAEVYTFLSGLPDVHGIAVTNDAVYYVAGGDVHRTPYTSGQRAASGMDSDLGTVPNPGRTTHGLAVSAGGTVYVTNAAGGSVCPDPGQGGAIFQVQNGTLTAVARGFRNPMYMRCHFRDELCMATELGDDGGAAYDAREKLFSIRPATNYGYPCCSTTNEAEGTGMSCADVTTEEVHFQLNDTPFGFDWERGMWTGSMNGVLCVAKHGSFYSFPAWNGVGIFCAPTDPSTHIPNAGFQLFVDGFGSQHRSELKRPADVAFGADGRMYFADDLANNVYFVAPTSLPIPAH